MEAKTIGIILLGGAALYFLTAGKGQQEENKIQEASGGGAGLGFNLNDLLRAQGGGVKDFFAEPEAQPVGFTSQQTGPTAGLPAYAQNLEGLLAGFNAQQGSELFVKKQLAGGAIMYSPQQGLPTDIFTRLMNVQRNAAGLAQGAGSESFYSAVNPATGEGGYVYAPKGLNAAFNIPPTSGGSSTSSGSAPFSYSTSRAKKSNSKGDMSISRILGLGQISAIPSSQDSNVMQTPTGGMSVAPQYQVSKKESAAPSFSLGSFLGTGGGIFGGFNG